MPKLDYTKRPKKPRLIPFSEIPAREPEFLLDPQIPLGALTDLSGAPGEGKTRLTEAVAAAISTGREFAGQTIKKGSVILLNYEDAHSEVVRPRLDGLEADLDRIFIPKPLPTWQTKELLWKWVKKQRPSLVAIDPLVAFLGSNVDLHRANAMREVTTYLGDLARKYGCAVVWVRHHTKTNQSKPIYAALGSIDISASCRSALMMGTDPEDPSRRAICHIKSSLSPLAPSLAFQIVDGLFQITGETDLTAEDILASGNLRRSPELKKAKRFLLSALSSGPKSAKAIQKLAETAGISFRTAERAKVELGIRSFKKGKKWFWEKP